MAEQTEKPTDINFTPEDIAKHSTRPALVDGWYQWLCTDAQTTVAKSGHLMIDTRNAPLADLNDSTSKVQKFAVRDNIILPFDNPNFEGHKAPNTAGLCHAKLLAIFGEDVIPDYPRVIEGVLTFKGEEIEKAEEGEARQEVTTLVFEKLQELWADPSSLIDQAFFGRKIQNGDYSNIEKPRSVLPDGVELLPRDQWEAVAEVKAKVKAPAKNGKPVTKVNGKKK